MDAIVVDPPYGINYQSHIRADPFPKIMNDQLPFIWFLNDAFRVCKDQCALLCFCIWRTQEAFRSAIELAGFKVRSQVIWDREVHGMGNTATTFAPRHDVIWFATKGKFRFPGRRPKSIIRCQKVSSHRLVHPTEKPVKLMADLIDCVVPPRGRLLDPCMGAGSTGVAAVQTGRRFLGIEQDRAYFQTAARRIQAAAHDRRRAFTACSIRSDKCSPETQEAQK